MPMFELVIGLLLAAGMLTTAARRIGVPYPSLLAIAGAAIAVVPGLPDFTLDPSLVLALFVAPVLLDAAYDASPRDLRANAVPVLGLVLVAVGLTVAAVAVTLRALDPGIPWAAAIAAGAIVAPPDAAAATAVLRPLGLPHRILVILEGESLLNDASALLIFRVAVDVAAGHDFAPMALAPRLLVMAGGGAVLGYVLARLYDRFASRFADHAIAVMMQFLGTFGAWIIADRLGVSAIITLVAYAITIARNAPLRTGARRRIASYAVWDVAVFVLNALAFLFIGLQVGRILPRLTVADVVVPGAVSAAVILVRLAWVMAYNTAVRWKNARFGMRARRPMLPPTVGGGLVIGWCGMRGVVTLAAALSLPDGFPARDTILLTAFSVVLVTLVAQGVTLGPLVRRLRLPADESVAREAQFARAETARAGLRVVEDARASTARDVLVAELRARVARAERDAPHHGPGGDPGADAPEARLEVAAVRAQRNRLGELRRTGRIGDDAFHVIEQEIDLLELAADPSVRDFPTERADDDSRQAGA